MDADSSKAVVDYSPLLLRSIWSLFGFATLFIGLRVYARLTPHPALWWDDHLLITSWVCLLVSVALLTKGVDYGIGLHFEDMVLENIPIVAEYSYAAAFATLLGVSWSKTSFAVSILRISNGRMRWFIWFIIISTNMVLITNAILLYAQCTPIKRLFDEQAEGTCWPKTIGEHYQTFCAVYSGVGDIVLAFLPWRIVWKATLFRREKLGILVAMSMGVFSGILSFLKIISLDDISDVRSTTIDLKIFGIAELAVTIIAVSIPILRVFIRRSYRSSVSRLSCVKPINRISISHKGSSAFSRSRASQESSIPMKQIRVTETVEVSHGPRGKTYHEPEEAYHGSRGRTYYEPEEAYHGSRGRTYYEPEP